MDRNMIQGTGIPSNQSSSCWKLQRSPKMMFRPLNSLDCGTQRLQLGILLGRGWVRLLLAVLVFVGGSVARADSSSANFRILQDTVDAGGGRSGSAGYTIDSSMGGITGFTQGAGGFLRFESGYAGQLLEEDAQPPSSEPTLSFIPDQTTPEDTPRTVSFTVGDAETAPFNLRVSALSSNPNLVPSSAMALAGTGLARTLTITPVANQSGTTTLTVTVIDESNRSVIRTFVFRVTPVNDLPVAQGQSVTTRENQSVSLRLQASDLENDTLTYRVLSAPTRGSLSGTAPDLTYVPNPNANGFDSFSFVANDGTGDSPPATISFSVQAVNQAPTLNPVGEQMVPEDGGDLVLSLGGISTGAANEFQNLFLSVQSSNTGVMIVGAVGYTSPNATAVVRLSPVANASGRTTITVTVSDDGGTALGGNDRFSISFLVEVTPVNDPPVVGAVTSQSMEEDTALSIPFTIGDVETDASALSVSGQSSNPGLLPHGSLAFSGSGANRTVTVTPARNQNGSTTVTLIVTDGQGGQASRSFDLTVAPVNDPPVANGRNVVVDQNASKTLTLTGSDVENSPLTFQITGQPTRGVLTGLPPQVTYTPNLGSTGEDRFTFRVNDGSVDSIDATVSISINAVSAAVGIDPIPDLATLEDTPVSVGVRISAATGGSFTLQSLSSDPALIAVANIVQSGTGLDRTLVITPSSNAFGQSTLTVVVSDEAGNSASRSFIVSVGPVDDGPVAHAQSATVLEDHSVPIRLTGADVENDALTFQVVVPPARGKLSGTAPNLTYTPEPDANEADAFSFLVSDGILSSSPVNVDLTVIAVNDPPRLDELVNRTVLEDSGELLIDLRGLLAGPANEVQVLAVRAAVDNAALLGSPVVSYSSPAQTGALRMTLAANAHGEATITVTVHDDGGLADGGLDTVTRSFKVSVASVNDRPTISPIANVSIAEDSGSGTIAFGVGDVETSAAVLQLRSESSNPTLIDPTGIVFGGSGADRTLALTPYANRFGTATITVIVRDADGGESSRSFSLNVTPVNDPPGIGVIGDQSFNEDTSHSVVFRVEDLETAAANLIVSAVSSNPELLPPANMSFGGGRGDRTLSMIPALNRSGAGTITITVQDDQGGQTSRSFSFLVNPVNDAPVALAQTVVTDRNQPKTFLLKGADVENSPLTFRLITPPLLGRLSGTPPNITYTPNSNATGNDRFSFVVNDGLADSTEAAVSLSINAVSDILSIDPVADHTTQEDTPTLVPFHLNITGTVVGELTVAAVSDNVQLLPPGSVVLGGSGTERTVLLTPSANRFGSSVVTLTVADAGGNSSSRSFVFVVNPVNDHPAAVSMELAALEDHALALLLRGTDPENDPLTYRVVASPGKGVLNGHPPSLTYIANPNATGTDTFAFVANDGTADSPVASVVIEISPINDAPTLNPIVDRRVNEDSGVLIVDLAGIGSGGFNETQAISVSALSTAPEVIAVGAVEYLTPATSGVLKLIPVANATGEATITLRVRDDGGTAQGGINETIQTFRVVLDPVNDLPTLGVIPDQAIDEDTVSSVIGFTVGDVETAPEQLVLGAESSNPALIEVSGIVVGGSGLNRSLVLTPVRDRSGTSTISVHARDADGGIAERRFQLTVRPVNDLPTVSGIGNQVALEDTSLSVSFDVGDVETAVGNLAVSATSSNQTLVRNSGLHLSANGANRTLSVRPEPNQNGTTSLTVRVVDGAGAFVTASFEVSVTAVNDAPAALARSIVTSQNRATEVLLGAIDVENDPLAFVLLTQPVKGVLSGVPPSLIYTPNANSIGNDSFTFRANDGVLDSAVATVAITINAVSELIVLSAITDQTVAEDGVAQVVFSITNNGATGNLSVRGDTSRPELVPASNIVASGSGLDQNVSVTPVPNGFGEAIITLTVSDEAGHSTSVAFRLTVSPVNDLPVAVGRSESGFEDTPISLHLEGNDAEGDPLSYRVVSDPVHGVLSGSAPNLIYTPTADFNGTDSFGFVVNDGTGDSAVAAVNLTLVSVNDPPTLDFLSDRVVPEDGGTLEIGLAGIGSGAVNEVQDLTLSAVSDNPAVLQVVGIDRSLGTATLRVLPVANAHGEAIVTVRVDDAGGGANGGIDSVSRSFRVAVLSVNDRPTLSAISPVILNEDSASGAIGFTVGDVESDAAALTLRVESSDPSLIDADRIVLAGSGANRTVTLTPYANRNGTATLTFYVRDGEGGETSRSFGLTVNPVNDNPTVGLIGGQSTNEDIALTVPFTAEDLETGWSDLVLSGASSNPVLVPVSGMVFGGSGVNRTLRITPAGNESGSATITITADDGEGGRGTRSFNFVVNPVNDPPVALKQSVVADQNQPRGIVLTGSDVERGALTFRVIAQPVKGVISGAAPNLIYTPNGNATGLDSFSFVANDGQLDSLPAVVNLNIDFVSSVLSIGPVADVAVLEDTGAQVSLV
jgi:hypothetical protein